MSSPGHERTCGRWEAAVVDLLDGVLPPEEERALREHAARCEGCGPLLEASERGRLWARVLHNTPPEPPLALFGKILAKTDALAMLPGYLNSPGDELPVPMGGAINGTMLWPHPAFLPGRQGAARWLMTGAMAFFSIALTASVSGVHPGQLRATAHDTFREHRVDSLQAGASRRFFDTKKQVVSFYDNLRVVRELENRVDGLLGGSSGGSGEPLRPSARLVDEPHGRMPVLPGPQAGERNRL